MINVTKSFLPPKSAYQKYIDEIWESKWLTNNGKFVKELENSLKTTLGVKHLFFLNNGTIAIQIALKALNVSGEVITTPFSYVATTSSLIWENCIPVYADILKETYCVNPEEIEKKITPNTKAILVTHVFGNCCDVDALSKLSKKYEIPIIYDAAHSFMVKYNNASILNFGDVSTLSFHATKLFHTVEGGAVVTNDDQLAVKLEYMRRFGHNGPYDFQGIGINGKNSEFHAAMGLSILPHMDSIIKNRQDLYAIYKEKLKHLTFPIFNEKIRWNYAYCPVLFRNESDLKKAMKALEANQIFPRRYFYPSLNLLPYIKSTERLKVSEDIALRILCLPLYPDLKKEVVHEICDILINTAE